MRQLYVLLLSSWLVGAINVVFSPRLVFMVTIPSPASFLLANTWLLYEGSITVFSLLWESPRALQNSVTPSKRLQLSALETSGQLPSNFNCAGLLGKSEQMTDQNASILIDPNVASHTLMPDPSTAIQPYILTRPNPYYLSPNTLISSNSGICCGSVRIKAWRS